MFNRRFLRVKILQALYAHFQKESSNPEQSLKELHLSISRTFDLFLYLMSLPLELKAVAERRMEENRQKAIPSEDDLNPNLRFVENKFMIKLEESSKLSALCKKNQVNWSGDIETVNRFYRFIRESDAFGRYMEEARSEFNSDRNFIKLIFENILPDFDLFASTFHERSIYWDEEDFDYARFLVATTLRKSSETESLDEQIAEPYDNKDDKVFVEKLFKETLKLNDEVEKMIMDKAKNWDSDRIAFLDMIIMKMAITEIIHFKQIPIKVSMNEYIDIAKSFSTPRSGQFINGIVDKVVAELKEEKRVVKVGRGLFEG